jgi:hypothetical protein
MNRHIIGSRVRAWWTRGRHRIITLATLATVFGLLCGLALGHWRSSPGPFMRRMTMEGAWIKAPGPPGYVGRFRRRLNVPGPVKHAWIAVTAREGFELCVNGNPAGRLYLWRPTRPFQSGLSEGGQVINASPTVLALNFPREYQWASHRNDWLPVFLDITPNLVPGRNVISVEIESRRAPAALRLDGEITLWSGERIRIDSGADWMAEPVPPFNRTYEWTEPRYPDFDWRHAVELASPSRDAPDYHFRSFDTEVLTTPFNGRWLRHAEARSTDTTWFRGIWHLPQNPTDTWIRLAVDRSFDLFVNGRRVSLACLGKPDLDSGDWILGAPRGADLPASAELLDPDEVGSLFVGDRFESPRHGDMTSQAYKLREDVLNKTRDKARATTRSDLPGTYDPFRPEGEGIMPHDFLPAVPEIHEDKALGRDRATGGVVAYNIRSMLQKGANTIEVRLIPPLSLDAFCWTPQLALDGSALFPDGSRQGIVTGLDSDWRGQVQDRDGTFQAESPCTTLGPAYVIGKPWPSTVYRGIAHDPSQLFFEKLAWVVGSVAVTWLIVASLIAVDAWRSRRQGHLSRKAIAGVSGALSRLFLLPISVLAAALLTENSWLERNEAILFRLPRVWPIIFLAAAVSPMLLTRPFLAIAARLIHLPKTRAWYPLLGLVLVLCGVLRIYKLDFQAIDDDEYASCQAVIAIARGGTPAFVPEGVFYTRSPFYHYLIGAVVWVFGENLWAMKLPTAMFGVATALLIYRIASKLLGRPWVGLAAMFFFTVHPYAIFSGHLVRFYQQQQFCAILAIYWFCLGYIGRPSQPYRYLTIFAFLAAVLSQEIMAVMLFQLALGHFLFGREAGWPANIRLALVIGVCLAMIVLDLLVFQTWCLTRTEGVSPNVEASIKPHFLDPYNLFSLFLGYSRLHVPLSIALLVGTPLLVRRGGRVIWALAFFLVTGVILTNLLVTAISLRYQYWMIPIFLILSFRGLGLVAERLAVGTRRPGELDIRPVAAVFCAPIVVALFLSFSPWRVVDSYDCKILNDSTGAFRYVRANLRPGDAIAANEPHPHAAFLEAGRVDYDLTIPMLQDFVMLRKGRLIDRNGGGEVIGSIDDLTEACRRHDRLWVVVNREKLRNRGKNLRWEYPGARLELFLRANFQVSHQTYLWTVFLWDKSRGQYANFRGP